MASGISEFGQNLFLDIALGNYSSAPSNLQVALLLSIPDSDDDPLEEPDSIDNYSRQTVSNSSAFWDQSGSGLKFSNADVVFPVATNDWGAILGYALIDPGSGEPILWGDLNDQPFVEAGQQYTIGAGLLSVSIDSHEAGIIV